MTDTEAPAPVGAPEPVELNLPVDAPAAVQPSDPAHDAIAASLARNVAKLVRHSTGVRTDVPGSVRKLRIAARRLRSDLYTFRPLLDEAWARELAGELQVLADGLSAGRDREVTLDRLERDVAVLPAGAPAQETLAYLLARRQAELGQARDDSRATVESQRTAALLVAMQGAAQYPRTNAFAERSCREELPPLVGAAYKRLAKRAKHLHLDVPGTVVYSESDDAWHEARIKAKRARYAADVCVPVFGEVSLQLAERLAVVTRCLGEHQDAAIAAQAAIDLGRQDDAPAPAALGLGLLHGVQREAVLAARAIFVDLWPDTRPFAKAHASLARHS